MFKWKITSALKIPIEWLFFQTPQTVSRCTLLGTNISFSKGTFEDDFRFPKVEHVSSLEGIKSFQGEFCTFQSFEANQIQNVVNRRSDFRLFIWRFVRIRYHGINRHEIPPFVEYVGHFGPTTNHSQNPSWEEKHPNTQLVKRNSHESRTQEKAVSFCLPLRAPVLVNVLKGLKQTSPSCYHRLAMECTLLTKGIGE